MAFISLNAKYQPLSFEEYIAPYVAHQQAYEKYTQGLEDLATDASKYAQYIPKDSQAYATQQRYLEGLKNASDVLYNEGMNINNNFNTVRALRKQYTDEILPINSAAQRLGALTDLASQYEAKGLRTFNMPSIDQLVQDGTLTFKTYSPEKIKQEGMLYGAALLANNPTKRYLQKIAGDPYHNVLISENKLDPQVYQELMSDPSNNRAIVSALATQGVTPNDEVFNEVAQQYILGVIEGSVRKEESQVLADEGAKAGLDLWKYKKQKEVEYDYAKKTKALTSNEETAKIPVSYINHPLGKNENMQLLNTKPDGAVLKYITDRLKTEVKNRKGGITSAVSRIDGKSGLFRQDFDEYGDKLNVIKVGVEPSSGKYLIQTDDGLWWRVNNPSVIDAQLGYNIENNKIDSQIKSLHAKIKQAASDTQRESLRKGLNALSTNMLLGLNDLAIEIAKSGNETPKKGDIIE